MATSQERPKTPPTEYGPSLSPPTVEELNINHISINIELTETLNDAPELNENTDNAPPLAVAEDTVSVDTVFTGTTAADNDSIIKNSGCAALPCILISAYLALIVNAILMTAVTLVLILLIIHADNYEERRMALIIWCAVDSAWRLVVVGYIAKKCPVTYTIIHWLGAFLGKEHYIILVNSLWPHSDPFRAAVDRPSIRINRELFLQGSSYAIYNLYFGIWFWVVTWKAVTDDYAKPLALTGLVACLVNIVSHIIADVPCKMKEFIFAQFV
ncbi:9100_t:CDS:2 [Paraglomus occultum]|uniref:9100_t:CDS:1 n=1 Tax=Paraglomus occultum TaxID=144539 RepID=A0A9N9FPS6_9GLOM|nr:9100_t:CDS:2 [Paraglomus occultum]